MGNPGPRDLECREWLRKATADLTLCEHELANALPVTGAVVFHCQQAAEKSLKAFLVHHSAPFRAVHDLEELAVACIDVDASIGAIAREPTKLTKFAWLYRYPGSPSDPTEAGVRSALDLSRRVYEAVETRVPLPARP